MLDLKSNVKIKVKWWCWFETLKFASFKGLRFDYLHVNFSELI